MMSAKMATKFLFSVLPSIILLGLLLLFIYASLLQFTSSNPPSSTSTAKITASFSSCNLSRGHCVLDPTKPKPLYDDSCPFHRNAWNCLRNKRANMEIINSWRWMPKDCDLKRIDPYRFLGLIRNRSVGFVGDSLNENFLVSFLCILRVADAGARKWKKKGAWRGA